MSAMETTLQDISDLSTLTEKEMQYIASLLNISFDDVTGAIQLVTTTNNNSVQLNSSEIFQASKLLFKIFPPVIFFLGTIGNGVSFVALGTFTNQHSTNIFMRVLAILDTGAIWFGLSSQWLEAQFHFNIRTQFTWSCKLVTFFSFVFSSASSWTLVILTFERFMALYKPFVVSRLFTKTRSTVLISVVIGLISLIYSHFLKSLQIHEDALGKRTCVLEQSSEELAWSWADTAIYAFVPFVILSSLNALIARKIMVVQKSRKKKLRRTNPISSREGLTCATRLCVVISTWFLLSTFPFNIVLILGAIINNGYLMSTTQMADFMLAVSVFELLMYANHATNFFLYILCGSKFRLHVRSLFGKARKSLRRSYRSLVQSVERKTSSNTRNISQTTEATTSV